MTTKKGKVEIPASPCEAWKMVVLREGIADAKAGNVISLGAVKEKWAKRAKG